MSDINQALGGYGAGYQATLGTETFTLMPIVQEQKAEYVAWVCKRAKDAALEVEEEYRQRLRTLRQEASLKEEANALSEEEREDYQDRIAWLEARATAPMNEYTERKTAGAFSFHGSVTREVMKEDEGQVKLLMLMLTPRHPGIKAERVRELMGRYQKELRSAVREAQNLGKSPSPGEKVQNPPDGQ